MRVFTLLIVLTITTISRAQLKQKTMQTSDKEQIVETIQGMFVSADKRNWNTCKTFFTEKTFIDYSSLSAIPGLPVNVDDLMKGWSSAFAKYKSTQHMLSNFDVAVNGDKANAFFYGHAIHYLPHAKGGDLWEVYGTYDAALAKTFSGWKISSLTLHLKYQGGNRNLPAIAANAPLEQKITFKSEGETITGNLLLPSSYKDGQKLPAIMVFGAWTQVKEQIQYVYGRKLAEQGFAVLNFDFRHWGESSGKPRFFESTGEKVKDVLNALQYLKTNPAIDGSNISLIGICAGAGIILKVATQTKDIKKLATVAAWLQHPSSTPLFYGGEEGVKNRITLAEAARKKFEETGIVDYVEAYNSNDPKAAMFFPLDYYGNPGRGRIPEWDNQFAVMGWKEWMTLNVIDGVAGKITIPLIMVHSDGSALPGNVKKFYESAASKNKKLVWLEGEHTQFYDDDAHIDPSLDEIVKFFKE
jgi:uncharacterized protein